MKIKAGIIGLGVGEQHIKGYNSHKDCEVIAICDFDKNKLEEIGALTLATKDTFKFSSRLHPEKEIYINRQNLKLKPENEIQYTYSCEIRNPGEFWQYVEQKLDIEKSRLKI